MNSFKYELLLPLSCDIDSELKFWLLAYHRGDLVHGTKPFYE